MKAEYKSFNMTKFLFRFEMIWILDLFLGPASMMHKAMRQQQLARAERLEGDRMAEAWPFVPPNPSI